MKIIKQILIQILIHFLKPFGPLILALTFTLTGLFGSDSTIYMLYSSAALVVLLGISKYIKKTP